MSQIEPPVEEKIVAPTVMHYIFYHDKALLEKAVTVPLPSHFIFVDLNGLAVPEELRIHGISEDQVRAVYSEYLGILSIHPTSEMVGLFTYSIPLKFCFEYAKRTGLYDLFLPGLKFEHLVERKFELHKLYGVEFGDYLHRKTGNDVIREIDLHEDFHVPPRDDAFSGPLKGSLVVRREVFLKFQKWLKRITPYLLAKYGRRCGVDPKKIENKYKYWVPGGQAKNDFEWRWGLGLILERATAYYFGRRFAREDRVEMRGAKERFQGAQPEKAETLPARRHFLARFLKKLQDLRSRTDRESASVCARPFKVWDQEPTTHDFPPGDSYVPGTVAHKVGRKTILVCAHEARKELFGGEWSFLDILEALALLDLNVIVTLPKASNAFYLKAVKRFAGGVYVFNCHWWTKGVRPSGKIIARFQAIIAFHHVAVVHVNTLMLREPLMAARNAGVASIVHVREMIASDPTLATYTGLKPEEIVRRVQTVADRVLVNSKSTAEVFGHTSGTLLVSNVVQSGVLDIPNEVDPKAIVFGLVGSNLRKKGIFDFIEVARLCEKTAPNAVFAFIGLSTGPGAADMKMLKRKYAAGKLPANLRFLGYKDTPLAAVSEANVVLNLSIFAESFGRSVAEAMAARRPVIAYAWGALPELVQDEVSGYLVPYRDVRAVAARVERLCRNPELIRSLGMAGRELVKGYTRERLARRLESIYDEVIAHKQLEKSVENGCARHKAEGSSLPTHRLSGAQNDAKGMSLHPASNKPKIAVVAHFFYQEQAEAILGLLRNLPFEFDLYASVPSELSEWAQGLSKEGVPFKKSTLRTVPNRGYDIAPFVCTFRDVYPAYDLVLKIHTKKSAHTFCLKEWGDYLWKNTMGSPEIVEAILEMFDKDKKLGMVYPEIISLFKKEIAEDPWQGNWDLCRQMGVRMGLSVLQEMALGFPAGSVFWFRPKALEPLFELGLSPEDFPEGKYFHRNGTLAHAIERLFVLVAQKNGFGAREVCFQPFKGVRDSSLRGRFQNAACCEWERLLHLLGFRK